LNFKDCIERYVVHGLVLPSGDSECVCYLVTRRPIHNRKGIFRHLVLEFWPIRRPSHLT